MDIFYGSYPGGGGADPPPLGGVWTADGCVGRCVSEISQEDADLCAARQSVLCLHDERPGTTVYYNRAQTCVRNCPDGLPFSYTVAAGQVAALYNQASADNAAYSLACRRASQNRICLGALTNATCANAAYSSHVSISPGNRPVTVSIVSGSIPPGLVLTYDNTSFTLSGTTTTPGEFNFTVRVQDANGNFMEKPYTICVLDIAWNSNPYGTPLPNGAVGTGYTLTFNAPSCASGALAPLSYQVSSGALPTGMDLNETTGILSGTPTVAGTYSFTIKLQTSAT
jgi:hypothetical protein